MTTTYTDFPFTHNGINYISRFTNDSPFLARVKSMPTEIFNEINRACLNEYLENKTYTLSEIQAVLDILNEGGSHAFIMLGEIN